MTKLDWDFFGAYIFALIVLGGLIAAGIAYGLPILPQNGIGERPCPYRLRAIKL